MILTKEKEKRKKEKKKSAHTSIKIHTFYLVHSTCSEYVLQHPTERANEPTIKTQRKGEEREKNK